MISERTNKTPRMPENGHVKRAGRAGRMTLSRAELAEFEQLLQAKRGELVGDIHAMANESPEEASELLDSECDLLLEIKDALGRIKSGTYGICEATGTRITKARLRACPWARYCMECARRNEKPRVLADSMCVWPDGLTGGQPKLDGW